MNSPEENKHNESQKLLLPPINQKRSTVSPDVVNDEEAVNTKDMISTGFRGKNKFNMRKEW